MADLHSTDLTTVLDDISSIRRQVAASTEFRGYGPATLALTGLAAILAAAVQARLVPDPMNHLGAYLAVWIITAVLASAASSVAVYTRTRRLHSGLSDEMLHTVVEQFMPVVAAGLLLTVVMARMTPYVCWLLPGLWQVVYALGVFSSCRFLPRAMPAAGIWFLIGGLTTIALGGWRALSPWTMGIGFGLGQMVIAAVLFFANHEATDEI